MSSDGIAYLQQLEGLKLQPYPDGNGYSIGYGHFIKSGEEWMLNGISQHQADNIFYNDLDSATQAVNDTIHSNTSMAVWDALIMFAYNIGWDNFRTSTLAQMVNEQIDPNDPAAQEEKDQRIYDFWLTTWVGSPAKQILLDRRLAEADYALGHRDVVAQKSNYWWLLIPVGLYLYSKS